MYYDYMCILDSTHKARAIEWDAGPYSKTCVKRQLKNRQNKGLNGNWLMKVKRIAECSHWSNTFDLH